MLSVFALLSPASTRIHCWIYCRFCFLTKVIYLRRGCLFRTSKISFLYVNAFWLFGTASWSWFVSVFVHERITTVNQAIYEQVKIILEDGLQSSPKRQEELKKEKSIYSAFLTYSLLHCEAILLTCQCFLLQHYYCNGYSYAESGHGCCRRLAFFCPIHFSALTSFSFPSLASLNLLTEWVFSSEIDVAFFVFCSSAWMREHDSHQSN